MQPLKDKLPGEVIVHAVLKNDGDGAQSDFGNGTHFRQPRQSSQFNFDRTRDELFHFGRRHSARRREHLHLDVGHIRKGVDGNLLHRENAETGEHRGRQQDEQPLADGEIEDGIDHGVIPLRVRL